MANGIRIVCPECRVVDVAPPDARPGSTVACVHCGSDLKPDNIMVGDFGEVLVMDWGLAKIVGRKDISANELVTSSRLESSIAHTMEGVALGTPAYMPPEQAGGRLDAIDHRSDIYSLGGILYEILTLERPVEGNTPMEALAKVTHGNIVPPEQRAPSRRIPRELSAIAMKCLSKNSSRRYSSVSALRRDVSLFLEGRSVSAAPDTFAEAVVKLVKRNRAVSGSVAAAAAVILVLTTLFVVRLKGERDIAVRERKAAREARDKQRATALAAGDRCRLEAIRDSGSQRSGHGALLDAPRAPSPSRAQEPRRSARCQERARLMHGSSSSFWNRRHVFGPEGAQFLLQDGTPLGRAVRLVQLPQETMIE